MHAGCRKTPQIPRTPGDNMLPSASRRSGEVASYLMLQHFPLSSAYLCQDCSSIGNNANQCPACASEVLMNLSAVLNRDRQHGFSSILLFAGSCGCLGPRGIGFSCLGICCARRGFSCVARPPPGLSEGRGCRQFGVRRANHFPSSLLSWPLGRRWDRPQRRWIAMSASTLRLIIKNGWLRPEPL